MHLSTDWTDASYYFFERHHHPAMVVVGHLEMQEEELTSAGFDEDSAVITTFIHTVVV